MNTTKKNLTKTRVEITVKLGKEELAVADKKALTRLAEDLKIPGFRKGKVPISEAKKHIAANDIASAALDIAVRAAIPTAFEGVQAISIPEVAIDKYVPSKTLEFRATSDILPPIKLGDYKSLKTKKPEPKLSKEDVDKVLDNLAKSFSDKKVVSRPAKLTDEVQIDFVGKEKGEPFEGGTAKDFKIILGSGQLIPGFESGIVGHSSGDKFDIDLTFPKDYHAANLAGKKVTFEILLKQVNEVVIPKIDDALAQRSGAFNTLKELKADIESNLKSQNERQVAGQYQDALVLDLVKISTIEAPESLIADQLRFINNDLEQKLKYHGLTEEQFLKQSNKTKEELEADNRKVAIDRVKAALVLQALAAELKIQATEEETSAKLAELKEVYKKDKTALENLSKPEVIADVRNRLTIERTLDALVKLNSK